MITFGSKSYVFDGFCEARDGVMRPDLSRPGHGLELKEEDAARYRRLAGQCGDSHGP